MTGTNPLTADFAFMVENDMFDHVTPQQVLQAIDPKLAGRSSVMPPESSYADTWMLEHGDPFTSTDAALAVVDAVDKDLCVRILRRVAKYENLPCGRVVAEVTGSQTLPDGSGVTPLKAEGVGKTPAQAILAAALKHQAWKETM
jgi:hypothetical protein